MPYPDNPIDSNDSFEEASHRELLAWIINWIYAHADGGSITVRKAGIDVGTRAAINLIEGANVSIIAVDDAPDGEVEITITVTGGAGSPGPQGPPGLDGLDGEDGSDGPPGPPGADGVAGSPGADGAAGPPGQPGMWGFDGEEGAEGPPGQQGASGPQGAAGTPGTPGAAGSAGPAGSPGFDGHDGEDAFPYPGPEGPRGPQGTAGGTGPTGPAGSPGSPGFDGLDGEEGQMGLPGPAGSAGAAGSPGATGPMGPTGMGIPGQDGEDGDFWIIPGPAGPKGDTGAGGGGGGSMTIVEKDLGSTPKTNGKFVVTDGAVTASSKILIMQAPGPYTGKGTRADEAEMDDFKLTVVSVGTGTFTVAWSSKQHVIPVVRERSSTTRLTTLPAQSALLTVGGGPTIIEARAVGKVRGNVKFGYLILT